MITLIYENQGSDVNIEFEWPVNSGDLTGWVADVYQADPIIIGTLMVEVTNSAANLITISLPWSNDFLVKKVYSFRLKITNGVDQFTTNEIRLYYR